MLTTGKVKVTVIEADLQDKDGVPSPYIKFRTDGGDEITWYGSLKSEKSSEIAVQNVVAAGFIGNGWDDLNKPVDIVFIKKEVTINIEENTYKGKTSLRVKSICGPGRKEYTGAVPRMADAFAKFKKEMGVTEEMEANPFF